VSRSVFLLCAIVWNRFSNQRLCLQPGDQLRFQRVRDRIVRDQAQRKTAIFGQPPYCLFAETELICDLFQR
jgi:hypothetical protein